MSGLKIVNINPIKMKSLGGLMKTEQDIINLIKNDEYMMKILEAAETLNIDDYWICAGFIRNKVWDFLHNHSNRTPYNDIDFVYFDSKNLDKSNEKDIEYELYKTRPDVIWEVVNQARMYDNHPDVKARCASDGITNFPETPTSVGIRLKDTKLIMTAPHGIEDLVNGIVNPTPLFKQNNYIDIYRNRLTEKSWQTHWPNLVINKGVNHD